MHKRGKTAHIIVVVQIKLPNFFGGLKSWKHEKQKTI